MLLDVDGGQPAVRFNDRVAAELERFVQLALGFGEAVQADQRMPHVKVRRCRVVLAGDGHL